MMKWCGSAVIFMISNTTQSDTVRYGLPACWRMLYLNRKLRMRSIVVVCGLVIGILSKCDMFLKQIIIALPERCTVALLHFLPYVYICLWSLQCISLKSIHSMWGILMWSVSLFLFVCWEGKANWHTTILQL